ncbi:MAG: permease-like cell division protein FtsX [Legionella sp.]
MLKNSKSYFAYHGQAVLHSLNLLCRRPLATLMTVLVIAIALALPVLFWLFTYNLNKFTSGWQQGGHISLYVKASLNQRDQQELMKKIQNIQAVGQVVFISPQEGLAELTKQEGMHDIMRYLPDNPLPAVIEVTPAVLVDSAAKLDVLLSHLKGLSQIEQAKVDMDWINRVHAFSGFVAKTTKVLMAFLALVVILIIGTTLRLTIHSRQEEVQVLKLIGASESFIMRPFLYSGIWYGLAGAIIAVFTVNIVVLSLGMAANQLAMVYQMHYPLEGLSLIQIVLLLFFAITLGWVGAYLSVKRQLASIEAYN